MSQIATRNANSRMAKKAEPASTLTTIIGRRLVNLSSITHTQRYQPLTKPLAELDQEALERLGVAIYNTSHQASFEFITGSDEQTQYLKQVREALAGAGLLDQYFELPDGTLLLPHLVQSADYGEMPNGWVVRLYRDGADKPLMTCLCSSEDACIATMTALSERLKGTSVQ